MTKQRKLLLLILGVLAMALLAQRYLRLNRDAIFYSEDLSSFTLASGVELPTNRWLYEDEYLGEGERLRYMQVHGYAAAWYLGAGSTEGRARCVDEDGVAQDLLLTGWSVRDMGAYREHWVTVYAPEKVLPMMMGPVEVERGGEVAEEQLELWLEAHPEDSERLAGAKRLGSNTVGGLAHFLVGAEDPGRRHPFADSHLFSREAFEAAGSEPAPHMDYLHVYLGPDYAVELVALGPHDIP